MIEMSDEEIALVQREWDYRPNAVDVVNWDRRTADLHSNWITSPESRQSSVTANRAHDETEAKMLIARFEQKNFGAPSDAGK